jgi:cell shape-determining protein MreC
MNSIGTLIIILIIAAILFIVLREFFAWYSKINQIVDLLTKIVNNLREIRDQQGKNSVT